MVRLYDVMDIRTGQYYSVVVVKQRNAKYFVPAEIENELIKADTY